MPGSDVSMYASRQILLLSLKGFSLYQIRVLKFGKKFTKQRKKSVKGYKLYFNKVLL